MSGSCCKVEQATRASVIAVLSFYYTGIRAGELAALRVSDITLVMLALACLTSIVLAVPVAPCPRLTPPAAWVLPPVKTPTPRPVPPAPEPARARSRALPLIQVRPDGHVVAIAPKEGVLPLLPNSPQWFACLTAFSFEGPAHQAASRRPASSAMGSRIQSWNVHRSLHDRSCTIYLGLTPTLPLLRLQEIAAAVHARLTAH